MAQIGHPYEQAFAAWLRQQGWPYVATEERLRARCAAGSLKTLDYIVHPPGEMIWLVDVKGRYPASSRCSNNWVTLDDITSLGRWEEIFWPRGRGLFVFAYPWPIDRPVPSDHPPLFIYHGQGYMFYGTWWRDYFHGMKVRSPRWQTVWLPGSLFCELRFHLTNFTATPAGL